MPTTPKIIAFVLACVASLSLRCFGQSEPTLSETLAWLKDHLTSDATFPLGAGLGKRFEPLKFESCTIQWKSSITSGITRPTISVETADLRKISPSKVTLEALKLDGVYEIVFATSDGKPWIRSQLLNRDGSEGEIYELSRYVIELKGEENGKRILKAFTHAVTLCNSQKEPF